MNLNSPYISNISRDSVSPPELTRDTPILRVSHELEPIAIEFFDWVNGEFSFFNNSAHFLRNLSALDVPLRSQQWFNNIS